MLPQISFLGVTFSTYWLMFVIGLVGMMVLSLMRTRYYHFLGSPNVWMIRAKAVLFALLLAVFGLTGTKILYILENIEDTIANGITLGGQSFYGALFLVPIAVALYGRLLGLRASDSTDYCAPSVIFILMCMRLGCFMSGCCGGITINGFVVPTQLIEAVADALIFASLLYKEETRQYQGLLYPTLMWNYGVLRFFLEFLRSTEKNIWIFSRGQLFSVIACVIAFVWIARVRYDKK